MMSRTALRSSLTAATGRQVREHECALAHGPGILAAPHDGSMRTGRSCLRNATCDFDLTPPIQLSDIHEAALSRYIGNMSVRYAQDDTNGVGRHGWDLRRHPWLGCIRNHTGAQFDPRGWHGINTQGRGDQSLSFFCYRAVAWSHCRMDYRRRPAVSAALEIKARWQPSGDISKNRAMSRRVDWLRQ